MEPAQTRIGQGGGNTEAGADVFGKPGMEGCRERQAAELAVAAYRQAERAFGRDMDAIGAERVDDLADVNRARRISG
jgi:hypothetical protein